MAKNRTGLHNLFTFPNDFWVGEKKNSEDIELIYGNLEVKHLISSNPNTTPKNKQTKL